MRMYERFSGCRVLSSCVMSNHFHILLEVPPKGAEGLSDGELLERLTCINSKDFVATVGQELARARSEGNEEWAAEIYARFTYRMNDLSEFMKTVLQRFTRWFNRKHKRTGTLWEERYKSVIVESGTAARTMAAYIDLNPVRAGMVSDPAEYRWSSYGEAVGGGKKGNGKRARAGLVRACGAENFKLQILNSKEEDESLAGRWKDASRIYRRTMGLALGRKRGKMRDGKTQDTRNVVAKSTAEMLASKDNETVLLDLGMARKLRCRVRYFTTDGAVIGSKEFVNEAFAGARERFSGKRTDGARRMKGNGKAAAGVLWSLRDLRMDVT